MDELTAGYYMVRYAHKQATWEPAEWDGERWVLLGSGGSFTPVTIGEVGPRIPTPDEPWQCVPTQLNKAMYAALQNNLDGVDDMHHDAYRDVLAVAPKP